MRRDRLTFAMMHRHSAACSSCSSATPSIPTRAHCPPRCSCADHERSSRARSCTRCENSTYFDFVAPAASEERGPRRCSRRARCSSCVNIPEDFTRDLLRGDRAVAARRGRRHRSRRHRHRARRAARSCSSPRCATTSRARSTSAGRRHRRSTIARARALQPRNHHAVQHRAGPHGRDPHDDDGHDHRPRHHARARARHDGEPALDAHAPERSADRQDRALHPHRLRAGRVILIAAHFLFHVPMHGQHRRCCSSVALVFIAANLAMGITFSTIAQEPAPGDADDLLLLPAVDPALGFHVPVSRHAAWAQVIGEVFPLTHFLRIVRGILLKGNGFADVGPNSGRSRSSPRHDDDRGEFLPAYPGLMPRLTRSLVLIAATCVAAGCTVGPDFKSPDPPPVQAYVPGAPASADGRPMIVTGRPVEAQWWKVFELGHARRLRRAGARVEPYACAGTCAPDRGRGAAFGTRGRHAVSGHRSWTTGAVRQRIDPATFGFPQAPNPGPFNVFSLGAAVRYDFDIFGGTRRELEGLAAQVDYRRSLSSRARGWP